MFSYRIDGDLELRLPEERHAEEAFALVRRNLDHLRAWLPWVKEDHSLEDARSFIKYNLQQYAENKGFAMQIVFQNRVAGFIGYNTIDWQHRRTEIGYWIGASFQGQGLVTKACRALIDHAFNELKLNRVEMHCGTENEKSRKIPERLGFIEEGVLRGAEWVHDHYNDLVIYAMLASNWRARNGSSR